MKLNALCLAIVFCSTAQAAEINAEGKKYIERQFAAYAQNGASGLIDLYSQGGPTMSEKAAAEIVDGMRQIEASCGKPTGFSVKKISQLAENTANAFFIIDMERCPIFFRQVIYRTKSGKVIAANFYMHTQPEQVWPSEIIYQ